VCECVGASAQAVVHVYVPELFPDEAPTLMLQSVVQLIDRVPLVHTPPAMTYVALPPLSNLLPAVHEARALAGRDVYASTHCTYSTAELFVRLSLSSGVGEAWLLA
jgi:hypothetical protein